MWECLDSRDQSCPLISKIISAGSQHGEKTPAVTKAGWQQAANRSGDFLRQLLEFMHHQVRDSQGFPYQEVPF
jgi:hypothetical protein